MAEKDIDDEFAEAAAIITVGIVAKGKLKRYIIYSFSATNHK